MEQHLLWPAALFVGHVQGLDHQLGIRLGRERPADHPPGMQIQHRGQVVHYLAAVLDLHTRRVIGWAFSAKPDAELVIKALDMAYKQRGKPQQVLFHSDQGSQYASRLFRQRLWRWSLAQLVEQLTFNQLVAGSNPARPTNFKHWFRVEIFQVTPVWVVSSVGRAVDF